KCYWFLSRAVVGYGLARWRCAAYFQWLYAEFAQAVSVSVDRAEVAAALGSAGNVSRLESRRERACIASIFSAARLNVESGQMACEVLHPGYVSVSQWRRAACGASRRLYRDGHSGAVSSGTRRACLASDGLGCIRVAGGT